MRDIHPAFSEYITCNKNIEKMLKMLSRFALTDTTILLLGETGTGKDILSYGVHRASHRANHSYTPINCASIPENLLESELFGYKKGAFTDAKQDKVGKIEVTHKGTLFLDEIGELLPSSQGKLLRAIENKLLERLGDTKLIPIDIRVIAATNSNLEEKIKNGRFRDDLYYRLGEIKITVPPLRERKEDIPLLINYFIKTFNEEFKKDIKGISNTCLTFLKNYDFPGNIRELRNLIKRAVILVDDGVIKLEHLPLDIKIKPEEDVMGEISSPLTLKEWLGNQPVGLPLKENGNGNITPGGRNNTLLTLSEVERQHIDKILKLCSNNKVKTARVLGIDRTTLYKKMEMYGIG